MFKAMTATIKEPFKVGSKVCIIASIPADSGKLEGHEARIIAIDAKGCERCNHIHLEVEIVLPDGDKVILGDVRACDAYPPEHKDQVVSLLMKLKHLDTIADEYKRLLYLATIEQGAAEHD